MDEEYGPNMWDRKKGLKKITAKTKLLKTQKEEYEEKINLIKEIFIPLKESEDKSNL